MIKQRLVTFFLVVGVLKTACLYSYAETHAVLPGNSIQAKIDIAVAGDIVAIFGGTYNEDLTIDKAIRLVEVSGEEVTITGNVTFNNVNDCPPFVGFTVGSVGRNITVNNTNGLILSEIDHTAGNSVVVKGASDLKITNCQLRHLDPDGGLTEISDCAISGRIEQGGGTLTVTNVSISGDFVTLTGVTKTIAFRTTVTGDCNWQSNRAWFGYGKARSFNFTGSNAKVVFVGSEIDRLGALSVGMNLEGNSNSYLITNSYIHNTTARGNSTNAYNAIEITGSNHVVIISNNYLKTNHGNYADRDYTLELAGSVTNAVVRNNIFHHQNTDWNRPVLAPFGVLVEGNMLTNSTVDFRVSGGVTITAGSNLSADYGSIFVDDNPYDLAVDSPCINAGTPDPRFNDRDGTRNDIGPSGGAWYDPEGWTTENPVVISFELSADQVLEGADTEIILSEGQAVSAP